MARNGKPEAKIRQRRRVDRRRFGPPPRTGGGRARPRRTDSEYAECRGVNIKRSSTPFLVHLGRSYIGSVSTGGNRGFGFLAKKLPFSQPIGTKFGPHILGTKTHRLDFFSRMGNSPNSRKLKFLTNFQKFISPKRAKIFSPNFQHL